MPNATDVKLWTDAANQIKASRERCQSASKSELYSVEVIAQSHDVIARSHLQIADIDYRQECGLAVLSASFPAQLRRRPAPVIAENWALRGAAWLYEFYTRP